MDFPAGFFHQHWESIGMELCEVITKALNQNRWDRAINKTFIVLIPKSKNPTIVSKFRPISLCNVLYKVMAKFLANRLKIILPKIISQTQSAFVPRRLIADNIIVAFEALQTMHCKLKGSTGYIALKLDMSKTYDILE